ncbi:MAG: HEPN domain-containing protein [Chitinophagales bacterium]
MNLRPNISPIAQRDILELKRKISDFQSGLIPEDKFKHFRLTRGVYGQRQTGVQMIRIKLPYGKVTPQQLKGIADVSDRYATGNLHLTTRQDIQLHYVKVNDAPQLWADLESMNVTLREACGNTIRNVTASDKAGIDPHEAFDVTPYAHAFAYYFLRNPICQDMGRKFKVAFSSSEQEDSALTFLHDLGFIPQVQTKNGETLRGFKVFLGGGLGAQAINAHNIYDFLPEDQLIPFSEAVVRVFDRHGERASRNKARMKFLIKKIGVEAFMELVEEEKKALPYPAYKIDRHTDEAWVANNIETAPHELPNDTADFEKWKRTNVFEQKQEGFYGIYLKIQNGDIDSKRAKKLVEYIGKYAAPDLRITINQGLLIKYVKSESLPYFFNRLETLGLAAPGFDSLHDITACPGSDTCNLAVTNSTELTRVLEDMLQTEFPDLIDERNIKIKISGCMNSCGQHMIAQIGFHGSSIKNKEKGLVVPAMQVVLGGGVDPDGRSYIADKVIKLPTKKIPTAVESILNDYEANKTEGEYFNAYYRRQDKKYFYHLLKPFADIDSLNQNDYIDWGHQEQFEPEIGVGECAGITLDVIGTVIKEAEEKLESAEEGLKEKAWADAIYNSYSAFVIAAKALLLSVDHQCNTQANIIADFDEKFHETGLLPVNPAFSKVVLQIKENEPTESFALDYYSQSVDFLNKAKSFRQEQIDQNKAEENKAIIKNYYKA